MSHRPAVCYTTSAMTVPFQKRFAALAAERSALCVGIDPSPDSLGGWGLPDDPEGLQAFCERMVEVCAPLVACVKPQCAFFERHGPAGMAVLRRTVEAGTARVRNCQDDRGLDDRGDRLVGERADHHRAAADR